MILKCHTTSLLDIDQKSTLARRRVVRVVLLIGNIQVCILPYVLQRSLVANFQDTGLRPHAPTYALETRPDPP